MTRTTFVVEFALYHTMPTMIFVCVVQRSCNHRTYRSVIVRYSSKVRPPCGSLRFAEILQVIVIRAAVASYRVVCDAAFKEGVQRKEGFKRNEGERKMEDIEEY